MLIRDKAMTKNIYIEICPAHFGMGLWQIQSE
jgi:hypothetical protein